MPTADDLEWPQGTPLFDVMWRSISEGFAGNGIDAPGDFEVTATANAREEQADVGTAIYGGTEDTLGTAETRTASVGDGSDPRWDIVT